MVSPVEANFADGFARRFLYQADLTCDVFGRLRGLCREPLYLSYTFKKWNDDADVKRSPTAAVASAGSRTPF
jgi:hypothetical protein